MRLIPLALPPMLFACAPALAAVIFSDDFQDGDAQGWAAYGKGEVQLSRYEGNVSMRLAGGAAAVTALNAAGLTDLRVSAAIAAEGLRGDDACVVDVSTDRGATWLEVVRIGDGLDDAVTLHRRGAPVAELADVPQAVLRLRALGSPRRVTCWFDDIAVTGEPMRLMARGHASAPPGFRADRQRARCPVPCRSPLSRQPPAPRPPRPGSQADSRSPRTLGPLAFACSSMISARRRAPTRATRCHRPSISGWCRSTTGWCRSSAAVSEASTAGGNGSVGPGQTWHEADRRRLESRRAAVRPAGAQRQLHAQRRADVPVPRRWPGLAGGLPDFAGDLPVPEVRRLGQCERALAAASGGRQRRAGPAIPRRKSRRVFRSSRSAPWPTITPASILPRSAPRSTSPPRT